MADLEKQTLSLKTVIILIVACVGIITSVVITSLLTVSSIKEEIKSVKTYSETEMRIVNLRLDALERQDVIHDKTLELIAKSLSDISKDKEYKKYR